MKKIIFSTVAFMLVVASGCRKFIDVNADPNRPIEVTEKLLLGPIEFAVAGEPGTITVNSFMQNLALNQPVPNIGTYLQTPTDFNGTWSALYVTCLQNLKAMQTMAEKNGNSIYTGISKVLTAYCLGLLTSYYGDVPYGDALKGSASLTPAYEKQEDIYKAMQTLLDQGIADLDRAQGLKPTSDDFFYSGDAGKWKKLAYTLKARYYMHLSKVYPATAQATLALEALQQGMTANADDLKWNYPGTAGFENRWWLEMGAVTTDILASNLVETLKQRNDPRLPLLVAPAKSDGAYRGREIGYVGPLPNLNTFSVVGSYYGNTNSPVFLVTYGEALFLKAEATLIKSGAAEAQPIFEAAVRANMSRLGIAPAAVTDYLAARGPFNANTALRLIIEEKAVANYLSVENFNDWRRTGYPELQVVPNASLPQVPRRFLYPQSELNTNPQPQHSASLTDRVWWDKP